MNKRPKFIGKLKIPGDKSVSHRALIFSLLSRGRCRVVGLSPAEDCRSTARCLQQLGASITQESQDSLFIESPGLSALKKPDSHLDAGNSGTTIRLLSGLLAGSRLTCTIDGDASLRKRPMARVLDPLMEMGAQFAYEDQAGCAPFIIKGAQLKGKSVALSVASAQVQTALLLAGLQANGETTVTLPSVVRDHTERMFQFVGVPIERTSPLVSTVHQLSSPIQPYELTVPGDISSAAFFMVAAACSPGSEIVLEGVGMNSGRTLVIDVLREMGASIEIAKSYELCGEPMADIKVSGSDRLGGATIGGERLASGIDEIPILALAGCFSEESLCVRDAHELKVKESDRLAAIVDNFSRAGANITASSDGFQIRGNGTLAGGSSWLTAGDHRLAMTGMVASLLSAKPLAIDDEGCARISYPQFQHHLHSLLNS